MSPDSSLRYLYFAAIALGAFLNFLLQPIIARAILPWFGGTPAVWSTAMLFFQAGLFIGYFVAYLIGSKLPARIQPFAFLLLLIPAALFASAMPSDAWKPGGQEEPAGLILKLLAYHIGLAYILIASTSSLVQRWYDILFDKADAYRLYALSNAGSLLGLLSFPLLLEPVWPLRQLASAWTMLFYVFCLLMLLCAVCLRAAAPRQDAAPSEAFASAGGPFERLAWFLLPACSSSLLLAITNTITHDIAVVPFLWILPLAIYLLTFILAFESTRWYARKWYFLAFPLLVLMVCDNSLAGSSSNIILAVSICSLCLYTACMICHAELVALKPPPAQLPVFNMAIAAGGAAGGIFVALIAPNFFPYYFEQHLTLTAILVLMLLLLNRDPGRPLRDSRIKAACGALGMLLAAALLTNAIKPIQGVMDISRNFFGVLIAAKLEHGDKKEALLVQRHGRIVHGSQYLDPQKARIPTAYFAPKSGIGLVFESLSDRPSLDVGIIGLGTGTLAAYSRPGDHFVFYEINPDVIRQAKSIFSYLRLAAGSIEVVTGDARLSLERESTEMFDVFIIDAFSGDAIPVHLLTVEALELYSRHMKPGGVMAFHITSGHLDLFPVVKGIANKLGLKAERITTRAAAEQDLKTSTWGIVSRETAVFQSPVIASRIDRLDDLKPIYWTDDYSSLLPILK